jgi:hypothetical protein
LRTGNAAIDDKDVLNLSNSDIDTIVNSLEAQIAQTNTPDRQQLLDIVTTLRVIQASFGTVGLGVISNGISSFLKGGLLAAGAPELAVGAGIAVIGGLLVEVIVENQTDFNKWDACINAYIKDGKSTPDCKEILQKQN